MRGGFRKRWKENMGQNKTILGEKVREALASVLPITAIVLLLCFTIAPVPTDILLAFLMGAVLLIAGMGLFTLGAETAMTPIGERVGAHMTRSRKLWVVVSVSFLIGVIITVSEPDLQVLAEQVPSVPNAVLVGGRGRGCGRVSGDRPAAHPVPRPAAGASDRLLRRGAGAGGRCARRLPGHRL